MDTIVRMQADIQKGNEETYIAYDIVEVNVFTHFTRFVFAEGHVSYIPNGDVLSVTPYTDVK